MPTLAELTPTFSTLETEPNSWALLEVDGVTGKISASDLRSALHADPILLQDGAISLGSASGAKAYIAAIGNPLVERTWYDRVGRVIKQGSQEGGGFEKIQYDPIGRVKKRFVACNASTGT